MLGVRDDDPGAAGRAGRAARCPPLHRRPRARAARARRPTTPRPSRRASPRCPTTSRLSSPASSRERRRCSGPPLAPGVAAGHQPGGRRASLALGLAGANAFDHAEHAGDRCRGGGPRDMNRALWPATSGPTSDPMLAHRRDPSVGDDDLELAARLVPRLGPRRRASCPPFRVGAHALRPAAGGPPPAVGRGTRQRPARPAAERAARRSNDWDDSAAGRRPSFSRLAGEPPPTPEEEAARVATVLGAVPHPTAFRLRGAERRRRRRRRRSGRRQIAELERLLEDTTCLAPGASEYEHDARASPIRDGSLDEQSSALERLRDVADDMIADAAPPSRRRLSRPSATTSTSVLRPDGRGPQTALGDPPVGGPVFSDAPRCPPPTTRRCGTWSTATTAPPPDGTFPALAARAAAGRADRPRRPQLCATTPRTRGGRPGSPRPGYIDSIPRLAAARSSCSTPSAGRPADDAEELAARSRGPGRPAASVGRGRRPHRRAGAAAARDPRPRHPSLRRVGRPASPTSGWPSCAPSDAGRPPDRAATAGCVISARTSPRGPTPRASSTPPRSTTPPPPPCCAAPGWPTPSGTQRRALRASTCPPTGCGGARGSSRACATASTSPSCWAARLERRLHDRGLSHLIADVRERVLEATGHAGSRRARSSTGSPSPSPTAGPARADRCATALDELRATLPGFPDDGPSRPGSRRRRRPRRHRRRPHRAGVHSLVKGNLAEAAATLSAAGAGDAGIPELRLPASTARRSWSPTGVLAVLGRQRARPTVAVPAGPGRARPRGLARHAPARPRQVGVAADVGGGGRWTSSLGALGLSAAEVVALAPTGGDLPASRLGALLAARARHEPGGPRERRHLRRRRAGRRVPRRGRPSPPERCSDCAIGSARPPSTGADLAGASG